MDEHIYSLANNLSETLNSHPLIIKLNELEKELNDSFEVYNLSNKKDECLEKYTRLKETLGENHKDTLNALKELKEAKEKLDNFPLVKEYLNVYNQVRDIYLEIDNILFADFRKGKKCQ